MNLKELARQKGTNIKKLSEKCGLPASTLYAIASGDTNLDNVGIDIFMRIARALDMSAEQLKKTMESDDVMYAVVELPTEKRLASDERELLSLYRRMDAENRARMMDNARAFAALSEKDAPGMRDDVERAGKSLV